MVSRQADSLPQPTATHYGDPFGEQRRLEAAELDLLDSATARRMTELEIGSWAHDAVRIASGKLGSDDVAGVGERIVLLHLDGSDNVLPKPGDSIYLSCRAQSQHLGQNADQAIPLDSATPTARVYAQNDVSAIGRVTSVGNHHELGPIAFAAVAEKASGLSSLVVATEDSGQTYLIAASVQKLP